MKQLGAHRTDFLEIWYLNVFRKSVEEMQVSLKYGKKNKYFTLKPKYICDNIAEFFVEWEMCQKKLVEKVKTHFVFNDCIPKIVPFVR
jgi:hypothetical protein